MKLIVVPPVIRTWAAILGILVGISTEPARATEPIRAHPQNSRIFEFRGQPTLLRTFGTSYDWMFDSSLNFIPYLDVFQRDGMNVVRTWCFAFPVWHDDDMIQPWPRSTSGGNALDGLTKWDFSTWDPAYFDRLKAFAQAASDRGIVVEFTFFSSFYTDEEWEAGPFHPANNVQGYGPNNRFDCLRPVDADLFAVQKAAVRRIVRELNGFDNVYFEIQNEPVWNEPGVKDAQEVDFHNAMLAEIRAEEAGLPNRHLVAHNFPQQASAMSADFDIINEHYPIPVPGAAIDGGEALLRDHYWREKILALDETNTSTALQTRLEVWMFFIGGGAAYDGLDGEELVYSVDDLSGDNPLGNSIRGAVRNAGTYMERLNLIALRRDLSWVSGGVPTGATLQASAVPGQQYVAYLHHGQKTSGNNFQLHYDPIDNGNHSVSLRVTLEPGTWRAVWTRPSDLVDVSSHEFTHPGGTVTLPQVTYQADIALRIDRAGIEDETPPPSPSGVVAVGTDDGSISLSWNPVYAADLAFYQIYRSEAPGVLIDAEHRIATLSSSVTGFTDTSVSGGITYFYSVTALDLVGNESVANRETSVTSVLTSQPFGGTPWSIPGIIHAEDFDEGGENLAYHDLSPANEGGLYRDTESVDIESTADEGGGHHVFRTEAGEWLQYKVSVAETRRYALDLRVANDAAGGVVHVEIDGTDVTGAIAISDTGGFASWQTVSVPVGQLNAGVHGLRLVIDSASPLGSAGAINWLSFTALPYTGPTAIAGPDQQRSDQNSDGVEFVNLDASASVAGDAPIVSYSWFMDGTPLANGVNPNVSLAVGEHLIQLVVTDANALSSTDELAVLITPRVFTNGGFEDGLNGWVASGNVTIRSSSPYIPTEGNQLAVFNVGSSTPNGILTQSFGTIPGQPYLLSFDMGVYATRDSQQILEVTVTGATSRLSQNLSISRNSSETIRWLPINLSFTADSTITTLSFRDRSSTSYRVDLLLDDVSLVADIVRTLAVESVPLTGVSIAVTPPDNNAAAGGLTSFNRVYRDNTVVTLTAPPAPSGYTFLAWLKNGVDPVTNPAVNVTMNADHTLTAVYAENPPVITSQPVGATVLAGSAVSFHVAAASISPLTYQWRFNGTDINGANTDTFTIASALTEHAGTYDVVVTSDAGSTTSAPAALTVIVLRTLAVESSPVPGLHVALTPSDYNGDAGGLTSYSRVYPENTVVTLTAQPAPSGYAFQAWLKDGADPDPNPAVNITMDGDHTLTAVYVEIPPVITSQPVGATAIAGSAASFHIAADSISPLTYQWRFNGTDINGANSDTYTIASVGSEHAGTYDVVVTNGAGFTTSASAELAVIFLRTLAVESSPVSGLHVTLTPSDHNGDAGGLTGFSRVYPENTVVTLTAPPAPSGYAFQAWLKDGADPDPNPAVNVTMDGNHTLTAVYVEIPPVITSQPAGATAIAGSAASFHVVADSISPLSFQWRFNGTDIPDTNTDTYTIASVGSEHAGAYDVLVTNDVGSTTSVPAELAVIFLRTLAVESSPVSGLLVTLTPSDHNGNTGGLTSFNRVYPDNTVVTLTAPPAPNGYSFQTWQEDGADPVTVPVINVTMDADHTLTAVYIENPPVITSQPDDITVGIGSSASFHVVASGIGSLTYQWRFNGTDIPATNSATYTIAGVGSIHAGSYDVVVTNDAGSTTSAPAELVVLTASLVNGSFEDGFNGWTTSGNLSILSGLPYIPTDGSRLVVFNMGNTTPNGKLVQSFPTIPGRTYRLTFDMGLYATGSSTQWLRVTVSGSGSLLSQNFSISRSSGATVRWLAIERSFTANSTTTLLIFKDISKSTSSADLLLDNAKIDVVQTSAFTSSMQAASVPIPQVEPLSAQASITSFAGGFKIHMVVQEPGRYELQRSRDLKTWEPVTETSVDKVGDLEFLDPGPPEKQMFYRIVLQRGLSAK